MLVLHFLQSFAAERDRVVFVSLKQQYFGSLSGFSNVIGPVVERIPSSHERYVVYPMASLVCILVQNSNETGNKAH
jgi:hypothetical protein